ncbi:hypothetical protein BGI36_01255 [Snodgrassella communis]|jgi:uncharacterized protein|uniref:HK97 family phage prohead protease n=1 Tax=Snodgrassella communis TaxID=2946699 RepID=UPI000C1F272A|nr:HK97 family phage prohead protease [Snodgrassella communis]PIT24083.1 hypothetical protein BGI36_01255 [Snodgrassella communis]
MNHTKAYGYLEVKSFDDDKRIITGIATTPNTDRAEDIVDPRGAKFTLPIPFLWQHDHTQPIGDVIEAKVTDAGIEVVIQLASIKEEGSLKDRLDTAWLSIKNKLVKGLSIGFRAVEYSFIENSYGIHYTAWDWYELSAVTIPANAEATITTVKQLFTTTAESQKRPADKSDAVINAGSVSKNSGMSNQPTQIAKEQDAFVPADSLPESLVGVATKKHLVVSLAPTNKHLIVKL